MHTHSLSIHPDSGRALRPWELALLLAVCVTLLTGTWAQARSQLLAARLRSCRCATRGWPISSRSLPT